MSKQKEDSFQKAARETKWVLPLVITLCLFLLFFNPAALGMLIVALIFARGF